MPSDRNVTQPRTGRTLHPPRVLIYGAPKVGKTTFAAGAIAPIILGDEDGAEDIDVAKFPSPESWDEVTAQVQWLISGDHKYRTVVLDTLDWLEPLLWRHVCEQGKKGQIEDFPYKTGYEIALDHWLSLIKKLELVRARGMTVVALAHAAVRPFQNPNGPDYDRWEMKIHKKASAKWQEWVDVIGFACIPETVTKDGKATTPGDRVLHTRSAASYVAGSRYIIPDPLPLDWGRVSSEIKKAFDSKGKVAA